MMDLTYEGHPLNGCLFEDSPAPAPTLETSGASASTSAIPKAIDLRPYCTPVENQQRTNSCVANAIVGAVELLHKKDKRTERDLSRLFLYYNARKLGDREDRDEGTYIHHGMAAVMAHGICEERMWPFQQVAVNEVPTQGCYENATHYEAIQFARTPGASAISALAQELPVAFGIVLPGECYKVAHQTGIIPPPEMLPVQSPPSGHAMLLVGYDLSEKMFIARNSWGPGYGKDGYILIPFDVMFKYAHPDQFWTIGAIERAPGLRLMGMGVEEAAISYGAPVRRSGARDGVATQLRGEIEGRLGEAKRGFADRLRGRN
ncbi:C1 family peptidase [uncultured Erythrobacter sp.]|uniref:C1 family peptidase n=1 Tax=uncultured Erythrobacter sp. TaxID=263913 RepID=UPI002638C43C|nr:C1 family peptidase [uncultured Erythrobacter sp.]